MRVVSTEIDTHTTSTMNLLVYTYNGQAHAYIIVDLVPYYGEPSVATFIGKNWLATFQGQWNFEVQQYFKEIQYISIMV